MKEKYIGIAINKGRIVGVEGYPKEGQCVITGALEMIRKGGIENDLCAFVRRFSLEGMFASIASISEVRKTYLQLPVMNYSDVNNILSYHSSEFIDWPEEDYYAQFVLRNPARKTLIETSETMTDKMDAYFVALPKHIVGSLANGLAKNRLPVEVIDYWPASSIRTLTEISDGVLVVLSKDKATVTLWDENMIVEERQVDCEPKAVSMALEEINVIVVNAYGTPIGGVAFLVEDEFSLVWDEDWAAIKEHFNEWERKKYHILPEADSGIDHDNISWRMAMGLLVRHIEEKNGIELL